MPTRINTNMKVMKKIPTMVASTNLKNCFIKKYNLFNYANLAIRHGIKGKSNIHNICYNMNTVFLLLGSNLGDRLSFLQQAVSNIGEQVGEVSKKSAIYETQAWGKTNEPDYLNQVLIVQTELAPRALLDKILAIELSLGRKREEKWGARTIDIDILFYNSVIINEPGLVIPHPQLQNRRFTVEPLAEIAPDFQHPVLSKTMLQLKFELEDCLVVKKL